MYFMTGGKKQKKKSNEKNINKCIFKTGVVLQVPGQPGLYSKT